MEIEAKLGRGELITRIASLGCLVGIVLAAVGLPACDGPAAATPPDWQTSLQSEG